MILLLVAAALAQDGRLQITVDKPVGLLVDGRILDYAEDGPYAIADGLAPGQHEISVRTMTNAELWTGRVEVPAGYEVRCRWKAKQFDCYEAVAIEVYAPTTTVTQSTSSSTTTTGVTMGLLGPTFGVVVHGGLPTTTTTTTTVTTRGPGPAAPPPPPPARRLPDSVEITIRSLDSEWVDVRVDGKVMLELRNKSEGILVVTPGKHMIEFIEFMADHPYASGRIDTGEAATVTFGIKEGKAPVVYDHDGWTPI